MLSPPRLPALWMGLNAGAWMASGHASTGAGGAGGGGIACKAMQLMHAWPFSV